MAPNLPFELEPRRFHQQQQVREPDVAQLFRTRASSLRLRTILPLPSPRGANNAIVLSRRVPSRVTCSRRVPAHAEGRGDGPQPRRGWRKAEAEAGA